MKLEEFKKYKRLAESGKIMTEEVEKVYEWMEESGRIDEGLFGSIWRWLKRNFSPTARTIYSLADEFEAELEKELRAEYGKLKDSKDLASRMRASYAGRMSADIQEKMEIEAEGDEVYRELVRELINKKTLEVKRRVLSSLGDVLDQDQMDELEEEFSKEIDKADKTIKKLFLTKQQQFQRISKDLKDFLDHQRRVFSEIIKSEKEKETFMKSVIAYVASVTNSKRKEPSSKEAIEFAKEYLKIVKEISLKLKGKVSDEEAIKLAKKSLNSILTEEPPYSISDLRAEATEIALKKVEDEETEKPSREEKEDEEVEVTSRNRKKRDEIRGEISTPETSEILSKDEISTAIETAEEETGDKNPKPSIVVDKVREYVSRYLEANLDRFTRNLNKRILDFNSSNEDKRKEMMQNYEYDLDSENKLKSATREDVQNLLEAFVDLAGSIVPYYQRKEEAEGVAGRTVTLFIFEIYAIKKDSSGKLSSGEKDKIVENIKKKYPDDFK